MGASFSGEKGAKGSVGATGAKGAAGAKGDTGPKGDPGVKGDPGAKGDAGKDGEVTYEDLKAKSMWCADGQLCTVPNSIALEDKTIRLRTKPDNNHGIRFDTSADGPIMYGNRGGLLATGGNGNNKVAGWDREKFIVHKNIEVLGNIKFGSLGPYQMKFHGLNKCADVAQNNGLGRWNCNKSAAQQFWWNPVTGKLQAHNGACLEIMDNNNAVDWRACTSSAAQVFTMDEHRRLRHGDKCIDVSHQRKLDNCNKDGTGQMFSFEDI